MNWTDITFISIVALFLSLAIYAGSVEEKKDKKIELNVVCMTFGFDRVMCTIGEPPDEHEQ